MDLGRSWNRVGQRPRWRLAMSAESKLQEMCSLILILQHLLDSDEPSSPRYVGSA